MKKIMFLSTFLCLTFFAFAQTEDSVAAGPTVYQLPDFVPGKVLFKNGAVQQASLNYNCLFQQMIFKQNDQMMAIENIAAIDTVFLGGAKYVAADTFFFEVKQENQPMPLCVLHTCHLKKAEQTGSAYSGGSATGAMQNVDLTTYRFSAASPYRVRLPLEYAVEKEDIFFVKQKNKLIRLKNSKQAKDILPGKEKELKQFIDDHKINFSKEADILLLLNYAGTLN